MLDLETSDLGWAPTAIGADDDILYGGGFRLVPMDKPLGACGRQPIISPKVDLMSVHVRSRTAAPAAKSSVQQASCRNGGRTVFASWLKCRSRGQYPDHEGINETGDDDNDTSCSSYDAQEQTTKTDIAGRDGNRSEPIETLSIAWKGLMKHCLIIWLASPNGILLRLTMRECQACRATRINLARCSLCPSSWSGLPRELGMMLPHISHPLLVQVVLVRIGT